MSTTTHVKENEAYGASYTLLSLGEAIMVYTQIQRIKRDINSITHKMHRFEKLGNTQRVYSLGTIRALLQESLDEVSSVK